MSSYVRLFQDVSLVMLRSDLIRLAQVMSCYFRVGQFMSAFVG
jgi:hypothetical protein